MTEDYISRYSVIKHSWKGKYLRVICIGKTCVDTINPNSIFKITNHWDYSSDLVDLVPDSKCETDIVLIIKKGNGTSQMVFTCMSTMERNELLTDVQFFRLKFDMQWQHLCNRYVFPCRKYKSNEEYMACNLVVSNIGITQRNQKGDEIGTYYFQYIKSFKQLDSNVSSLIIEYSYVKKLHLFILNNPQFSDFVSICNERASKYVGRKPFEKTKPISSHTFDSNRLGVDRNKLTSNAEFPVTKITAKHKEIPLKRILATTESYLVERDPNTYNTISAYPLQDVYALIRFENDAQKFMIEYKNPYIAKAYTSPVRDALLAHLIDTCRSLDNANVCVLMKRVDRGKRAAPYRTVVNEEIESTLLRCLIEPSKGGGSSLMPFHQVVEFFNANIEYNGLRFTENKEGIFAENREKLIFQALQALLENFPSDSKDPHVIVQQFYALRRLCVTRIGFSSVAVIPCLIKLVGTVSVKALKMNHLAITHSVIDFLCTLMTPHHNNYDPYHEQVNKNRMLNSDSFLIHLLKLLRSLIETDNGALAILKLLDFICYSICPPYTESTEEDNFKIMISLIIEHIGKSIYLLFGHPCKAICFCAGNIVRAILEEGNEEQFINLQRAALSEGGFLRQFHAAIFSNDRILRDLSRKLVAYWTFDNQVVQDLLRRMLPLSMLQFLQSKEEPPKDELEQAQTLTVNAQSLAFLESKQGWFKKKFSPQDVIAERSDDKIQEERNIISRVRHIRVDPTLNWPLFFYQLKKDHLRPDLIWNHATRNEMKEAIEAEIKAFQVGIDLRKERSVCWNYNEFEIHYTSLDNELKIGNHYPRLLFESTNPVLARPKEFFNDMYHRFLLVPDFNMKNQCLNGMSLLYKYYPEQIGQFNDIGYVIKMLELADNPTYRDRLLIFISSLLNCRLNVKPFIENNGVKPLLDLLPLAHLHIDRPQVQSVTNAIEFTGSPLDLQGQEKEWHYTNELGEKCDPVSYSELRKMFKEGNLNSTSKVWAQGIAGWKELKDIPQLKWGLLLEDVPSVLTLTELSATILDILLLICAYYPSRDEDGSVMFPLPRVKRFLSEPAILPHIVQLLLTFDPSICSRVHSLLYILMDDNPLVSRFFLTGVFFFGLMYMGSDILPLCRLLHLTHRKQSIRIQHDNEIIRSSILSTLLPPALVCFLHNHGAIKFAEIFLGEYETPEAIWGKDMRRYLVEKIAAHISDFTPRLLGNVRATYQYLPVVNIEFVQLQKELFCSFYYLRHFCDELRYPNWPVKDPVALMKDCLAAWKLELEKEPCTTSREACLEELEINDTLNPTPAQVRKAYFKLAPLYHPDKNPNGREKFEALQRAYEFLASEKVVSDAPDPFNISLLLKTQAILFKRFSELMSKYKYAGYGLLLKLVEMELQDPSMLTKNPCLMDPAIELAYYTVHNAPLNADELIQEGGIEYICSTMERAFEQILPGSKDSDNHVRIAMNSLRALSIAASFPDGRERILNNPHIPFFSTKAIAYVGSPALSKAGIECSMNLCSNKQLQEAITNYGAIWHVLKFLFKYDYTLEESGIEVNESNHTQFFANTAAKEALRCIYALVGFQPDKTYVKTEPNVQLFKTLQTLLTPYILKKMRYSPQSEGEILKILNTNHETPVLLWNNSTRAELLDLVDTNSAKCRDAGMYSTDLPPLILDKFTYSLHADQLVVAGIFVQIYNKQPSFSLDDHEKIFQEMIMYIDNELKQSEHPPRGLSPVVEALRNICIAYPVVYKYAEKKMPIFIYLLSLRGDNELILKTFQLLSKMCMSPQCIEAVGRIPTSIAEVILAIDHVGQESYGPALEFIKTLTTSTTCVQQILDKGFYVILIYIFISSRVQNIKEEACICLAKCVGDKLNGPKIALRSAKLIPLVMIDTMKENPTQVCQLFDSFQENPELVWTKETKERTREKVDAAKSSIVQSLSSDKNIFWKIPDDINAESAEDIQVGGVYLCLFIKQPGWNLRKPREFLMAILEKFVELCSNANRNVEILEIVTNAIVILLTNQQSLTDYIISLGYIGKIINLCESEETVVAVSAVRVLHEIASSRPCVESMTNIDVVKSIIIAMSHFRDDIFVVMDTLERLMSKSSEKANMVQFAFQNRLVQKLLDMLESKMVNSAQPAAARAIIVKVIKAIISAEDPFYGPQIQSILDNSEIWARYKDQSHELFLATSNFGGFLTGSKNDAFLTLTAPPTVSLDSEPPPL